MACGQVLDAPLRPGSTLLIDSRSAGLEITATATEAIHVTCTADSATRMQDVRIRFAGSGGNNKLEIHGGDSGHGGIQLHIEVPKRTNLQVRMGAGEVKVENVKGDKDIALYAGQITISSPDRWDYRNVDASVDVGQVSAPAYGVDKGGFFRHFTHSDGSGEFQLHAHVTTGEIDLRGAGDAGTPD